MRYFIKLMPIIMATLLWAFGQSVSALKTEKSTVDVTAVQNADDDGDLDLTEGNSDSFWGYYPYFRHYGFYRPYSYSYYPWWGYASYGCPYTRTTVEIDKVPMPVGK